MKTFFRKALKSSFLPTYLRMYSKTSIILHILLTVILASHCLWEVSEENRMRPLSRGV